MNKISIVVPVYKTEEYLRRCVDSILAQTFSDFELILVDDGSPDNSGAICDEYAQKDARVYVIHQENCGLSAARNAGINWALEHSDSEYLAFIDSDDWVHEQYLNALFSGIQKHGTRISSCGFMKTEKYVPDIEANLDSVLETTENVYTRNGETIVPVAWGRLFEKTLFSEVRFPENRVFEDLYMMHRVLFSVSNIALIREPLYYYYVNMNSITNTIKNPMMRLEAYDEVIEFMDKHRYTEIKKIAIKSALLCMWTYLQRAEEKDKAHIWLQKHVRNRMRRFFFIHGLTCGITLEKYPHYYNVLFPRFMYIYWGIRSRFGRKK